MKYLFLLLFLVGCGHTPEPEIVTVFTYVDVVCLDSIPLEPIKPLSVVFVRSTDTEGNQTLGLRGDQYSNLSINSAEVLRYIKGQRATIIYYEKCIENHNSTQNEEGDPE